MPPKPKYAAVKTVKLALADLKPAEYNARTITNEALVGLTASMEEFGLLAFPIVNKRNGSYRIVGGHQRVEALSRRGETHATCIVVEFDDAIERQANFALNNRAIQGSFIPELTKALLDELNAALGSDEHSAAKFESLRFDSLLKQITRSMKPTDGVDNVENSGNTDDDQMPSVQKTSAFSRVGGYYQLGDHVLLCGKVDGKASLAGFPCEKADAAFTFLDVGGNAIAAYVDVLLMSILNNVDGPVYIGTKFDQLALVQRRFVALNGHWSNTLLFFSPASKGSIDEPYRDIVLPVLYGWREASPHYFCGKRDSGNVFKLKRAPKAALPVEVVTALLINSTKAGTYVFDPCVGMGASVIAAQKTGRKLIGYVSNARDMDSVRKRWAEFALPAGTNWKSATPELKP